MDQQRLRSLDADPLERLVAIAGHVSSQRWNRVTSARHGLSSGAASVLLVLALEVNRDGSAAASTGRATSGELARLLWVRPATVTGIVDNLERSGLVRRVRDRTDRRQVWVTLTPAGLAVTGELGAQLQSTPPMTQTERDREKAAIVRQYLIELIALYHDQ